MTRHSNLTGLAYARYDNTFSSREIAKLLAKTKYEL